ncbi:MAG: winged helix-turn-helix domain-containing protein [Novosphingobium sp.]|uniref:protein kinase domain-containing protein n=1 Tax=Novosphingobium sp. TaxID=1874826 RepID=UPI001D246EE1|nr:winged helix-turn-helix domain-containing protein [Novosphingobium sp.]MCB2057420.1 winged helix-turn-helix domain-containing protein [Novosphingobium sp.]MCP5387750.1 winged helix-turn-helix domain-containing protein [Novosphingobium sp.]
MAASRSSSRRRRRLWKFSGAEFDEAGWELRIEGRPVTLESKPLEVLHELLLRAGEVVTKDELLDAVWPEVTVVEGSLATAISKLRKAFGERESSVIETVPRVGYRLIAKVEVESIDAPLLPRFNFAPGGAVPGRRQWRLVRALGDSGGEDVWLAGHDKTREQRVFKFADAPDRLRALKREAALSRVVLAGLGSAAPLPALLEWNFESSPYFLEYAHGGRDLLQWAQDAGGLTAIALDRRIAVAARIARALAAVHALGVLHKDLKPANILIDAGGTGMIVRLADFGSGRLLHGAVLDQFGITNPGMLEVGLDTDSARSGTLAYRAPELVGDATPTIRSDIYALGLILYQLVVGDFDRALAPGWEADVPDPLLREDVAGAARGDPQLRFASADELALRLERLAERREAAAAAQRQAAHLAKQQEAEARRQQRRPWVQAAVGSLVIGLVASTAFGVYAWSQRNQAIAARALADTSYSFVAEDVLGSVDPARAGGADETVVEAIKRASANIDRRYPDEPGIAARLHLSLARAFYGRADFDTARAEFARSQALFAKASESGSEDAALGRLALIHMNSVSGQPDRLEEAGRQLAAERKRLGPKADSGRLGFALAQAEGAYGYMADPALAEKAFRRAVAIAAADPAATSPTQALKAKSSLVVTLMRLGRAPEAEPVARAAIAESVKLRGEDHPDTLVTRQHLLNALSMMGKHDVVIRDSAPLLAAMERRLGPQHRFTLALRSTRFESFAALGRHDEAAEEAKQVWQGAAQLAGPTSHQALVGQIDYAAARCLTAERAEGLRIAREALGSVRQAFGADYPLTHAIRYFTAECLIANSNHAEAGQLLTGLDRQKVQDLTGQTDFAGRVDLALAEIALAQGDRQVALRKTRSAASTLKETDDIIVQRRLEVLALTTGG